MDPKPKSLQALIAELRQTERIAHLTRLAARGFNRSLSRRLGAHDISFSHWTLLRILWQFEGLTQRELSEIAQLTEPTVHASLAKMEALGMVDRRTDGANRRKLNVFLTEAGWALRDRLEPLAVDSNEAALEGLSAEEVAAFRATLLTVLDNLARDEDRVGAQGLRMPATRRMRALRAGAGAGEGAGAGDTDDAGEDAT